MSPSTQRALNGLAWGWAVLGVALLAFGGDMGLLDHRPGGAAFETEERPIFVALFGAALLAALRWRIVGGAIAALTAAGVGVFAAQQLRPVGAVAVIVALAVPAVVWLALGIGERRPPGAALGALVAIGAVVAGALVADAVYDGVFGPTHPGSDTAPLPDSPIEWVWSGAVTETGFSVVARVTDGDASEARLVVGQDADLGDGRRGRAVTPDGHGVVRLEVTGLEPGTAYRYAVEVDGVVDLVRRGSARTLPRGPSSFTVAVGGDARVGSDGAVFDTIRATDPLLYLITGDLHYGDVAENDVGRFEEVLDLTLSRPAQAALYRSTPVAYVWDDHDFGGNDSDPTVESAPAAQEAYRRYVPHYPLAGPTSPVYQAFTIGRVRFVLTDGRSGRTPASAADDAAKTMLGVDQKAWLKQQLLDADDTHALIVWVNPLPWITEPSAGSDGWGGYTTERRELADFISDNDIDGLLMIAGDAHMLAIDDGTNSDYSDDGIANGFPVFHAAALDRGGETKGGPYTEGAIPGGGQFGLFTVTDDGGDTIVVSLSGRNWAGEELMAYELEVPVAG